MILDTAPTQQHLEHGAAERVQEMFPLLEAGSYAEIIHGRGGSRLGVRGSPSWMGNCSLLMCL